MQQLIGIVAILSMTAACAGDGGNESAAGPTPAAAGSVASEPTDEPSRTEDESAAATTEGTEAPASVTTVESTDAETTNAETTDAETTDTVQSTGDVLASGTTPPPAPGPTVTSEIDEPADFGTGVTATLVDVEAVEVEGRLPGERSGPGVVITVRVTNDSTETVDLNYVTVDMVRADGSSAIPVELANPPGALRGSLDVGASASGRYQFFIPVDQRPDAIVSISYAADAPTALFTGGLPSA